MRAEGQRWLQDFHSDLDYVIEKRQEHIHPKDKNGVRQPLTACRTKDKPGKCKHGFMKDNLICSETRLLCPGLAKELELPTSGRRNAVGSLEASRSSGSVNGCISCISVGGRDNNDIKVPYRLPILEQTHERCCKERCFEKASTDSVIDAVETAQSAQVGYHCDYANKRQPLGIHEANEWAKGHKTLATAMEHETITYATRRHAQRIVSDCFARGILRTPNETTKLNDIAGHTEPTAAEVTSTGPCVTFNGEAFLALVEQRTNLNPRVLEKGLLQARSRNKHGNLAVVLKRIGLIYGFRGTDPDLLYLSPYEFMRYWRIVPFDTGKKPQKNTPTVKVFDAKVVPAELAQSWILMRKLRPDVPKFHGCPMPKSGRGAIERTARILLTFSSVDARGDLVVR